MESLAWVISRFSPLLRLQASFRVRGPLARLYDPEDVVDEVWVRSLPHIATLTPRDGRLTPVLLRFLGTTLLRLVNELMRKHVRGKPRLMEPTSDVSEPLNRLPADVTEASERARRGEVALAIDRAVTSLSESAREVFVLRGIEQFSNQEVARRLGESEKAVSMRYSRALDALRETLPQSLVDELAEV